MSSDKDDTVWDDFLGVPNTNAVLEDKAKVVAHLIVTSCLFAPAHAGMVRKSNPTIRFGEEEVRQAVLETAAFLVCLVDRLAPGLLNSEDVPIFMDALIHGVPSNLRARKGIDATSVQLLLDGRIEEYAQHQLSEESEDAEETNWIDAASFQLLLSKRYEEYVQYQKWVAEEGEGTKGTLFWAFGKKVAAILGVGPNIWFDVTLTNSLLKKVAVTWKLKKLLTGINDEVAHPALV